MPVLSTCFRELLMDIYTEAAKPVSLHFSSPNPQDEAVISVTAVKSFHSNQIFHRKLENHLIHSLDVLHLVGINIQYHFI